MPAGICRSIAVSGGGAVPSSVDRVKAKLIVVGAPRLSGVKEACRLARSLAACASAGARAHSALSASAVSAERRGTASCSGGPGHVYILPVTCTVTASFMRCTSPLNVRLDPCAPL